MLFFLGGDSLIYQFGRSRRRDRKEGYIVERMLRVGMEKTRESVYNFDLGKVFIGILFQLFG